jgi:hypothetical protein|nr:MAG TPA: hypothetical protein [Caudoviricetes sp.]
MAKMLLTRTAKNVVICSKIAKNEHILIYIEKLSTPVSVVEKT